MGTEQTNDLPKHMSWFLGPKAEQAEIFEKLLLEALRDHVYWRRNYIPKDPRAISTKFERDNLEEVDKLSGELHKLMADLRRNFPFNNPRYIAHELSDVTMASILGYFATMLYNPNNVTTEAAAITVEFEVEVCNQLLEMLGFNAPEYPPNDKQALIERIAEMRSQIDKSGHSHHQVRTEDSFNEAECLKEFYELQLRKGFGWCHLTAGGTSANVEAIWVARNIRLFSLAVQEVVHRAMSEPGVKDLTIEFFGAERKIDRDMDVKSLLCIPPSAALDVFRRYLNWCREYLHSHKEKFNEQQRALGKKEFDEDDQASVERFANELLLETGLGPRWGVSSFDWASLEQPGVIVGSDLRKAVSQFGKAQGDDQKAKAQADLIDQIQKIETLTKALRHRRTLVGKQPEDELYPRLMPKVFVPRTAHYSIYKILDLLGLGLGNLELVDADSSFRMNVQDLERKLIRARDRGDAIIAVVAIAGTTECGAVDPIDEIVMLRDALEKKQKLSFWIHVDAAWGGFFRCFWKPGPDTEDLAKLRLAKRDVPRLSEEKQREHAQGYATGNSSVRQQIWGATYEFLRKEIFRPTSREELFDCQKIKPTGDSVYISWPPGDGWPEDAELDGALPPGSKERPAVWRAFDAFRFVDSITVDPHKLGYSPYPAGSIAFRSDAVRRFIWQRATYITSVEEFDHLFLPPHRRVIPPPPGKASEDGSSGDPSHEVTESDLKEGKSTVEAFGPFILEGSRPGATAGALTLATRCIPLTTDGHGRILRSSIRAANELYQRLLWANDVLRDTGIYFSPIPYAGPDTNILAFFIGSRGHGKETIRRISQVTERVSATFTIDAERGSKRYSYEQLFFVSHTKLTEDRYPWDSVVKDALMATPFLLGEAEDSEKVLSAAIAYRESGMFLIRCAVMSPYIDPMNHDGGKDYIGAFIEQLVRTSRTVLEEDTRRRPKNKANAATDGPTRKSRPNKKNDAVKVEKPFWFLEAVPISNHEALPSFYSEYKLEAAPTEDGLDGNRK